MLNAALEYSKRGYFVFPCWWIDETTGRCACGEECASPAKHPRTAHGLNDSTIDETRIRQYWEAWPRANVAIDCGRSGLAVVDVDTKKGALGKATIRWYLERYAQEFQSAELVSTPTGGYHYYLTGATKTSTGALGAGVDIRSVGGYVLAPPSIAFSRYDDAGHAEPTSGQPYTLLRAATQLPALPVDLAPQSSTITSGTFRLGDIASEAREFAGNAREAVPHGEHRQALLWLAWHLRRVHGFTTDAALPTLQAFIDSGLAGYDPTNPFQERDLRGMLERIEPQVATNAPDIPTNPLEGVITGIHAQNDERPLTWLVPYFIAEGELTLLYGEGGVGKSTWFSLLAAEVTQLGDRFGAIGVEEPFSRFCARSAAMGADRSKLYGVSAPAIGLKFREHLDWIERYIYENELRCLYFDSLRSHFELGKGEDSATNARNNLSGIASLSQRTGCAILGTFHTNKSMVYSGSSEMLNVPRIVIEAKAAGENKMAIRVHKGAFKLPDYRMVYAREEIPYVNAAGQPMIQTFRAVGQVPRIEQQTLAIWKHVGNEPLGTTTLGEAAGVNEQKDEEIRRELRIMPALSANMIYKKIGGNRQYVLAATARIKAELGIA
jgi:energy-coupling factor transporter ATP-binding protein EcfA2